MRYEDEVVWLRSTMSRADIVKAIPRDALEALCREYDIENGEYPESDYEGCALSSYFRWMEDAMAKEEIGAKSRIYLNETSKKDKSKEI